MEDFTAFFIGVCVVIACGIFFYNSVYGGRYSNITNSDIGDVYHFEYEQPLNGGRKRYFAKVIEPVYTLNDNWINTLNKRSNYRKYDSNFQRTNHIVTCKTRDGNIRQFYCERITNCKQPIFGKLLFTK
jgi:hypothetical protein